jgi:hypothetical protein
MATREQVRMLLDGGHSYETAARELGIPAGLAFMLATGRPADGSAQHLVNPPAYNPTRKDSVMEWVRERARRELGTRAVS